MITSAVPKLPFIDKQATLDFYVGRLAFELTADHGDYMILFKGPVELHFFAYLALDPRKSDFMIYLRVDEDIEGLYEQYKSMTPPMTRLGRLELKPWA